jgi:hypothetical protein
MLASGTRVCGFFRAKSRLPHVADLRHVKEPCDYTEVGSHEKYAGHFSPDSSTFRCQEGSLWWGRGGIWRWKWELLKAGESNGKLPLRTCLERSVPEPYRSPDWALVPPKPAQELNTSNKLLNWGTVVCLNVYVYERDNVFVGMLRIHASVLLGHDPIFRDNVLSLISKCFSKGRDLITYWHSVISHLNGTSAQKET